MFVLLEYILGCFSIALQKLDIDCNSGQPYYYISPLVLELMLE